MKYYKSIENFSKINLSSEIEDCNFKELPTFLIDGYFNFGKIQINENFISTILHDRPINLVIPEACIDDFLCVFLKNRIVLSEKIKNEYRFNQLINKKYWQRTALINLDGRFLNMIGYSFVFQCVECSYVSMNNNTEIIVPLFENG
jgi:hypothetical protein